MMHSINSIRSILLISTLLVAPCISLALDVIYLKNGSIIKGSIIEHNIAAQEYKIKSSGNLFVYTADKITKITKEQNSITEKMPAGIVINTNNNQDTINNNNNDAAIDKTLDIKPWKLFARLSNITITKQTEYSSFNCSEYHYTSSTCKKIPPADQYGGSGGGLSYALNNHLVLRISKISATHTINNDVKYNATIADLLLATNAQLTGWNWYLGYSYINQELDYREDSYIGITLGLEYNFENIFIGITGTGSLSDSYNSDYPEENTAPSIGSWYLGIRF